MIEMLKNWYQRHFSDPQAMALFAILFFGFVAIYFFNNLLAPLLIAIVLAYLLEYPIRLLNEKLKVPRILATFFILGGFIALTFIMAFILIPTLWTQTVKFVSDLPHMFNRLN